jgi:hypothetical protein
MNNLKALKQIENEWSDTKNLKCLEKIADTPKSPTSWLLTPLKSIFGKFIDLSTDAGKGAFKAAAASIPISAVLSAVIAKNVTSPEALAENADKYVLLNTLDTEIAVLNRKIAAEELRREELKNKNKKEAYDRFV